MATCFTDEIFQDVAYKANTKKQILSGLDEFLDSVTVIPPGEWDPSIRIEPPETVADQNARKNPGKGGSNNPDRMTEEELQQKMRQDSGLVRSGRLFGGLINDIKRKAPL